jgi:hypothetical protein
VLVYTYRFLPAYLSLLGISSAQPGSRLSRLPHPDRHGPVVAIAEDSLFLFVAAVSQPDKLWAGRCEQKPLAEVIATTATANFSVVSVFICVPPLRELESRLFRESKSSDFTLR